MCWCFNVRDHTLTIKSLVPMHRYPESGAVREYNHFPISLGLRYYPWIPPDLSSYLHLIVLGLLNIGPYLFIYF
jgi:hypothetical protein